MPIAKKVSSESPAMQGNGYTNESLETIKELQKQYRGLREEDLDSFNPSYSCVICGSLNCESHNKKGCSCPKHINIPEYQWILFYDFYKDDE